jgi:hypothetical protein
MWYSKEVILTAFAALRALTASMSSERKIAGLGA